jgi:hypothetical protein
MAFFIAPPLCEQEIVLFFLINVCRLISEYRTDSSLYLEIADVAVVMVTPSKVACPVYPPTFQWRANALVVAEIPACSRQALLFSGSKISS